jgi:hypothetical protein
MYLTSTADANRTGKDPLLPQLDSICCYEITTCTVYRHLGALFCYYRSTQRTSSLDWIYREGGSQNFSLENNRFCLLGALESERVPFQAQPTFTNSVIFSNFLTTYIAIEIVYRSSSKQHLSSHTSPVSDFARLNSQGSFRLHGSFSSTRCSLHCQCTYATIQPSSPSSSQQSTYNWSTWWWAPLSIQLLR